MAKKKSVGIILMLWISAVSAQMWAPDNPTGSVALVGGKKTIEETAGDVALKDKLLNWQYSVDYYDDSDMESGAVPREKIENHDFIVISESASSSRVRQIRRWEFSTPTINMEPASVQNTHHKLELIHTVATGNGWMLKTDENANKIRIVNGDHPLAAGYPSATVLDAITNQDEYVAQFPFAEGIIGYMVDEIGVIPIASFNTTDGDTALVICGIEVGTLQVDSVQFHARYVQFNLHSNTIPTWTPSTDSLFVAAIQWILEPVTKVNRSRANQPVEAFKLYQNYPNPFNPATTIEFELKRTEKLQVKIYDLAGKEVRTLADGEFNSGFYSLVWDGKNNLGEQLASGVYFYSVSSTYEKRVRKMTLLK